MLRMRMGEAFRKIKRVGVSWAVVGAIIGVVMTGCDGSSDDPLTDVSSEITAQPSGEGAFSPGLAQEEGTDGAIHGSKRPLRIVAFGDSLTAGFGVAPDQAYPSLLERRLRETGYNYEVINAGVSGDTTAGGLRRVNWVLKSEPFLVILELGANDGLRGLSLSDMEANLRKIIQRFQEAKVPVLLIGMKIPPNYGEEYTKQFEAIYPRLAKEFDFPLMPFFLEGVAIDPRLNQGDGIHPNAEGYRVIVENLLPILTPLLDCQLPSCR